MAEVRMPKMGDGMEEGTVLQWLKKVGDHVKANEPIAEIETDKATVEMPAEDAGVLSKIVVGEGETVAVGALIAYIGSEGPSEQQSASSTAASSAHLSESTLPPSPHTDSPSEINQERVKASPLARRRAREAGVDLARISGSGPGGRIVERDIASFISTHGSAKAPHNAGIPAVLTTTVSKSTSRVDTASPTLDGTDFDVSKMRKAIARTTVQSKQTIPHFYLVTPVEMDRAVTLIADLNQQGSGDKVTINDLIVKACTEALKRFPDVNVSWTPDDKIRKYAEINIGIAVGTDEGLTIPVVRECRDKSLRTISAEARALIAKARANQLTPAEMSGGTFSVSNLGMFGIEEFMAIISPPQSAILAVGAIADEVLPNLDGGFMARKRMRITLSCDHRTVDGLLGARFLQEVRQLLERPLNLLA